MARKRHIPPAADTAPANATPPAKSRQTHFWLADADVDIFDTWEYQLKRSWRRASRSAFMRVLLNLIREVDVDLNGVTSEKELTMRIRAALDRRASE